MKIDLTKLVGDTGPTVKFIWAQKCSRCSDWRRPYCVEVGTLRKSLKSSLTVILAKYYSLLQPRLPSLNTRNTCFKGFVTRKPQTINSFATGIAREGQAAEMVVEGKVVNDVRAHRVDTYGDWIIFHIGENAVWMFRIALKKDRVSRRSATIQAVGAGIWPVNGSPKEDGPDPGEIMTYWENRQKLSVASRLGKDGIGVKNVSITSLFHRKDDCQLCHDLGYPCYSNGFTEHPTYSNGKEATAHLVKAVELLRPSSKFDGLLTFINGVDSAVREALNALSVPIRFLGLIHAGSRGRKTHTDESDLDLVIKVDHDAYKKISSREGYRNHLYKIIHQKLKRSELIDEDKPNIRTRRLNLKKNTRIKQGLLG